MLIYSLCTAWVFKNQIIHSVIHMAVVILINLYVRILLLLRHLAD